MGELKAWEAVFGEVDEAVKGRVVREWVKGMEAVVTDFVSYEGRTYICISAGTSTQQPIPNVMSFFLAHARGGGKIVRSEKDLAIDAIHEAMASGWSRATFLQMLQDPGELGTTMRRLVGCVERTIEADRKRHASLVAPS